MINLLEARDAVPDDPGFDQPLPPLSHRTGGSTITCIVGPEPGPPKAYLHMLSAFRPPRDGRIKIVGKKIERMDDSTWAHVRRRTAYVAGDTRLLSVQDGLANVMLPALYHRVATTQEVERRACELLKQLGSRADLHVLPAYMNRLEYALVRLARALILGPQILYLDYPFAELGSRARKAMGEALSELRRQRQLCIIATVDNLPFVRDHADRILFVSRESVQEYDGWNDFVGTSEPAARRFLEDEGGLPETVG